MPSITISPTDENFDVPINGVKVPCRVWIGITDSGAELEAYVVSIVPERGESKKDFHDWADKAGLVRSRDKYDIKVG